MPPRSTAEREPLSRNAILAAAIDLADREGVRGLSMRKLARELGFEVMALYNHIANKNDLLELMVDSVASQVEEPNPDLSPLDAVRATAIATRDAMVRHPWASELWLGVMPGPARSAQMELLLRTLHESGLSEELAHHGFHAVTNHVNGYTLQERAMNIDQDAEGAEDRAHEYLAGLSDEAHPYTIAHVHQHLNGETTSSFELVLDLILDGLVALNQKDEA